MGNPQLVATLIWGEFWLSVALIVAGALTLRRHWVGGFTVLLLGILGELGFSFVAGFSFGRSTAVIGVLATSYMLIAGRGPLWIVASGGFGLVCYFVLSWLLSPLASLGGVLHVVFGSWGIPIYAFAAVGIFVWRLRQSDAVRVGTLAVALIIAACACSTGNSLPASVTATQLAGNHKLYLDAAYNQKVLAIEAYAYAGVTNGTAAVLQANGPASWNCPGVFANHGAQGGNDFRDLPYLEVGSSTNVHLTGPPGQYTITVSIPSQNASVSRKITTGPMAKDGTGSYSAPAGCVSTPTA